MEKIYVVTLHNREDLDGFYSDMASEGYRLYQKRPISRNTHYWMTEAQAAEIKTDSRVWDVELRPEDLGITPEPFALQNFTTHQQTGTFRKSTAANYTATDFDWGKLHCAGTDSDRDKGTFGGDGTQSKTATATIFNDGKHVDVVICDNQVSIDMKEWDSGSGSSRYVQYDWYTELNSYVTSIDDDGITIPSPPYNNYFSNTVNETYHGTHVAGTVAGKTYGWAKEANIYSMQVLGNFGGQGTAMNTYLMFDYLRAFHRHKAVNATTGRRNPTITNHSWGYGSTLDPWDISELNSIIWRGVTYNSSNPNPSGWTTNGVEADFGLAPSKRRLNSHITAIQADVEDAIEDGVVIIGAAGNNDYYMVPQQNPDGSAHQDWDNRAIFNTQGTRYFCRGSSPNSSPNVICVGYIYDDKNFKRNPNSNFGPAIDVWAPGTQIISCWGKPGVIMDSGGSTINYGIADTKYGGDPQYCYPISGTSMASPQVCGIAACLATNKERFTNDDVLSYIQKNSKVGDMTFDAGPAGGQSTYFFTSNATGSGAYIVSGTDLNGAVSGNNPTISMHVGDTVQFQQPPSGSMFCQVTAVSNSAYTIQYSDRTVMHSNPGGSLGPSDNPTINMEVGDAIDFSPATNMSSHPLYIKTAATTGSGDQVTTGTTYGQGGISGTGWDTNTGTTVVPGTYYYQCGNHAMGGQIIVHAAGTYYNHPLYIKTQQGSGTSNQVTGAINQGSNRAEDVVEWQANAAGTYYYQCALHSGMNGQIVVTAQPGVLGQNGNFSDPTCQKDSPNRYILAVNPRPTSGLIGEVKGSRVPVPKAGTSRQLFPRTRTVYEQT
jgi:plastocyanin